MNRKRVILTSCSIILLCTALIVGVTYAIFSEQAEIANHLQAGELRIKLTRTKLEYNKLDDNGYLSDPIVDSVPKDFSNTNDVQDNIFGIEKDTLIVPGSFYEATMQIENHDGSDGEGVGDVAFTYQVQLKIDSENAATEIAKQINVTVTKNNGDSATKLLSEFANEENVYSIMPDGVMNVNDEPQTFKIRIEFIDDDAVNYLAENGSVKFDIYVVATQKTEAPGEQPAGTTETDTGSAETDTGSAETDTSSTETDTSAEG